MPAVFEPAEHRAVMGQSVEFVRHVTIAQPGKQRAQHGQQSHALALHDNPEIEREPPPAALLQLGAPLARAIDDAMAKTVLEFDPPTFTLELRHGFVYKIRPVPLPLGKTEGNSVLVAILRFERLDGLQPEFLQPL